WNILAATILAVSATSLVAAPPSSGGRQPATQSRPATPTNSRRIVITDGASIRPAGDTSDRHIVITDGDRIRPPRPTTPNCPPAPPCRPSRPVWHFAIGCCSRATGCEVPIVTPVECAESMPKGSEASAACDIEMLAVKLVEAGDGETS